MTPAENPTPADPPAEERRDLSLEQLHTLGAGQTKAAGAALAARLGLRLSAFYAPTPADVERDVRARMERLAPLEAEAVELRGQLAAAQTQLRELSIRHPAGLCEDAGCGSCSTARQQVYQAAYDQTLYLMELGSGLSQFVLNGMAWAGHNLQRGDR